MEEILNDNSRSSITKFSNFKVATFSGFDNAGQPVICFNMCRIPSDVIMDSREFFTDVKNCFKQHVQSDYSVVIFMHPKSPSSKSIDAHSIVSFLKDVDRTIKKNIKSLYVVHPTKVVYIILKLASVFSSAKFKKKLVFINRLQELFQFVPPNQLDIDERVKNYNESLVNKSTDSSLMSKFTLMIHPNNNPSNQTDYKTFNSEPSKSVVFGASLESLYERKLVKNEIPEILYVCSNYILENGLDYEGIFRRSASIKLVNKAIEDIDNLNYYKIDSVSLAAVLIKRFFRDLPEPILTYKALGFIDRIKCCKKTDVVSCLNELISSLPEQNRKTLSYFFKFLETVENHSKFNLMNSENLSIVIGPNLLWTEDHSINFVGCGNELTLNLIKNVSNINWNSDLLLCD